MSRVVGRLVVVLLLTAVLAAVVGGVHQFVTWPDVARLATSDPASTAFIDRHRARVGSVAADSALEWHWVPDSTISPHLKRAVVAAEDLEFFSHGGFSTFEIVAAVRDAWEAGRKLRGASTITQQLAKNLWLSPSRNPWRKVKELLLTAQLEKHLSKRRILELYLNVVEFGEGIYGAEAAAQHYFGKSARSLAETEAAMLAASLPRPSTWHPGSTSSAYAGYVEDIRDRMDRASFLWRHVGDADADYWQDAPVNDTLLEHPEPRDPPGLHRQQDAAPTDTVATR